MTSQTYSKTDTSFVGVSDTGRLAGEDNPRARYTDEEVEAVLYLRREGFPLKQIAKKMDMPLRTIRDYINGTRRTAIITGWKKKNGRTKTHG